MLRNGVKPQFVGTDEADAKKREQVESMLARAVGTAEVDAMLSGQVPHPVEFDNHRSFYDNSEFAVGEVVKMVVNGTLEVYGPGAGKPKVVNPLGVVNLPKGRLVVNARYVNLFSKRQAFKYETLREVLTFLTEQGFFTTWDFKAGYYHLLIHPAFRKYFGIKLAVEAGSDASESGFGGTIKIPGKEKLTVAGALSDEEKRMSSTAREMVAFLRVLSEARARAGNALKGSAVLLLGDNQGAVRAVNAMNSRAPDVNEALRQLFELCVEADFDVIAQWRPRAEMQEEDDLSKHQDSSDWGLGETEVRKVLIHFGVKPAIDLFASETWHITERFVSLHLAPVGLAADAMRSDWSELLAPGDVAWVFPPVRLLSDVIQSVRRFRTDCILVVPEAPATNWWMALQNIGAEACLSGPLELPRSASICAPSFRVSQGTVNPAMYKLRAFGIRHALEIGPGEKPVRWRFWARNRYFSYPSRKDFTGSAFAGFSCPGKPSSVYVFDKSLTTPFTADAEATVCPVDGRTVRQLPL
ncbi:Hypothetical protein KFL_008500020, partial [Klebsormidium nitens]